MKVYLNKLRESALSILPVTIAVIIFNFIFVNMPIGNLLLFLGGAVFLIFGMSFFSLGSDTAMMEIGEQMGGHLTKSGKLWLILIMTLLIGIFITVAEPDLSVLAQQVENIDKFTLLIVVGVGVGLFLCFAVLRILLKIRLRYIFTVFYAIIFILAIFIDSEFLPLSFDSGGVTTGPITTPFIMAFGIGFATAFGGKNKKDNSFGIIAMCSIGPILAVMLLGVISGTSSGSYEIPAIVEINSAFSLFNAFGSVIPTQMLEVFIALLPICLFFTLFQCLFLKLPMKKMLKIFVGILYTYIGLVLFFTGVTVGFMQAGNFFGKVLAEISPVLLIIVGSLIGVCAVVAEPAVAVLTKQVSEISNGTIKKSWIIISLCIGVMISTALSLIRVVTGISIWWFILPIYFVAIVLSYFVKEVFTAIAFDSGGVVSGPMTASFLLPMVIGACGALGGNIMADAFGLVGLTAVMPLLTIQFLGLIHKKSKDNAKKIMKRRKDFEIIEFDIEGEV